MVHLRTVCYGGQPSRGLPTVAHAPVKQRERRLEAPPGFEPGVEVLQTSALPLGDGAARELNGRTPDRADPPCVCRREEIGAGNGIRTRDFDLGKVALYH